MGDGTGDRREPCLCSVSHQNKLKGGFLFFRLFFCMEANWTLLAPKSFTFKPKHSCRVADENGKVDEMVSVDAC